MIATSGDRLLNVDAVALYEKELFHRASLITPNLDEAGVLLKREIKTLEDMLDGRSNLGEAVQHFRPPQGRAS